MRQYLNLLVANIKMTLRNRQSIFWQFVFPVLLMSLFAIVFSGGGGDVKLLIVNKDKGRMSKSVVKAFSKIKGVKVTIGDLRPSIKKLKDGDVDAVIVFPKDFSSRAQATLIPAASTRGPAGFAESGEPATSSVAKTPKPAGVALYYDPAGTFTSSLARGTVVSLLGETERALVRVPRLIKVTEHSVRSSNLRYIDFLVPGVIAMTLMNSAMFGLGGTVVNYRERGILRRLKVTPQPLGVFIAAQISNQLLFSVVRAILLVLVGSLFGVVVTGSYWLLLVVVIVGSLCFTTIAFSVASFSRTRETADTLGNIISMPMMFLGGVFFPVDSAPAWVQPLIKVLPLKYLADAMRAVMVKGLGFTAVRTDILILLGVTAFFFAVSVRFWRWE